MRRICAGICGVLVLTLLVTGCVPRAGTYYLGARTHAWDMPRPGEPYGRLGGDNPQPVAVKKGTFVEGLTIEMLPFDGEYKPGKSRRTI